MATDMNDILKGVYKDFFGKDISGRELGKSGPKADSAYKKIRESMDHMGYSNAELDHMLNSLNEKIYGDGPVPSAFSGPADPSRPAAPASKEKEPETATATADPAAPAEESPKEPETDPMDDLNSLTGLTNIKEDVKELINFVKTQKLRKDKGMKTVPVSLHLVFSGNPGTGKTTVARILARLYKQIGVLSKGQLVEVDRSNLVAGYVGQTAIQTQAKIKEAKGGVLFIDEAYTLATGTANDFGQEAIDTILKAMEDNREDFVVIVAGYTDLMKKFINSNPGLKSRFNKYFEFQDYTAEELIVIFDGNLKKYEYTITDECREIVKKHFEERVAHKDKNFANAREVRNYFEEIVTNQASRLAALEDPDQEALALLTVEDLPEADRPKKDTEKETDSETTEQAKASKAE